MKNLFEEKMSTNVITKKSPTSTTTPSTNNTSYISMMTPNVPTSKRRESSNAEDSVRKFDQIVSNFFLIKR